jgi:hypothetical protein
VKEVGRDLVDSLDEVFADEESVLDESRAAANPSIGQWVVFWIIGVGNGSSSTPFPLLLECLLPCGLSTMAPGVSESLSKKAIICRHELLHKNPCQVIDSRLMIVREVIRFNAPPA